MARRNQPYLPLYVDDFQNDERLMECSAEATGVYVRLMCLMHKSEEYGKILLKQKDKQTNEQIKNFALKLAKFFPYDVSVVDRCLVELLAENVLHIDGDYLVQRRMVRDCELSDKRALSGKNGGETTQQFAKAKPKAKGEAKRKANAGLDMVSFYSSIIEVFNTITGRNITLTDDRKSKINARVKESRTFDDFKLVIESKYKEWKGTEYEKFIDPETLFGTKFTKYLEAAQNNHKQKAAIVIKSVMPSGFNSAESYYWTCLEKEVRPVNYYTRTEMSDEELETQLRTHKVGKYQYA